jgi:hypothetical protein
MAATPDLDRMTKAEAYAAGRADGLRDAEAAGPR